MGIVKGILEFLAKNNRWAILLVLLIVGFGTLYIQAKNSKIDELQDKYATEVKLSKALLDSVTTYQNKEKEWVAEKLSIQTSMKDLESKNLNLTNNQKELIRRVNGLSAEKSVITAALIDAKFVIDSLTHTGEVIVDTTNNTVEFKELNDSSLRYVFLAIGVQPVVKEIKPSLLIKNLTIPNKQFVEFHWLDDKKEGYPIGFSVTNTNKYIKVYDIDSYAIPSLKKEVLNPTGWQKFGQWMKDNSRMVKFVGAGVVIGAGGTYLLMK